MFNIILTLSIMAFIIGIEKFVMIGIIQYVSTDLNVSLTTANYLSSIYSISVSITGPFVAILFRNISKKTALLYMLLIIIIGNLIIAIGNNFTVSAIGRIIASFAHASFFGLSSILVYQLIQKDKRAFAISLVSLGLTFSNIIGVPLCTFISHNYGWRWSFGFISILSIISIGMVWFLIPKNHDKTTVDIKKTSIIDEINEIIHNPCVWSILLISLTQYIGFFSIMSYVSVLITDFLKIQKINLPFMLSIFGIGMACGTLLGGKLYDYKKYKSPIYMGIIILLIDIILPFVINTKLVTLSMFLLFILAACSLFFVPFYKAKIVEKAIAAPSLASTVNIIALNLGLTFGSLLSGILIKYYKVSQISFFSAGIIVITIGIIIYNLSIDKKSNEKYLNNEREPVIEIE